MDEWAMVPKAPTEAMHVAAVRMIQRCTGNDDFPGRVWGAMLRAAPEPPHLSMTREEAQTFQSWAGMDGACAFHLIERHANGWGDVARMMDAWLQANSKTPNVGGNRIAPTQEQR